MPNEFEYQLSFTEHDRDIIAFIKSVDIEARSYVIKQLIRIGIHTDVNPYIKKKQNQENLSQSRTQREVPRFPVDPEFSYSPVKEPAHTIEEKKTPEPHQPRFRDFSPEKNDEKLQTRALSKEERLKAINEKINRFQK